jgi:hypothetical protein
MTMWLNPVDQAVRSAVTSGAYGKAPHSPHGWPVPPTGEIDTIADALQQASDTLSVLTGWAIHPAMEITEDYLAAPEASSLRPSFQPLRNVVSLGLVDETDTVSELDARAWSVFGGSVRFRASYRFLDIGPGDAFTNWYGLRSFYFGCYPRTEEAIRLVYNTGSTMTASARAAVLSLAHELWLQVSGCSECGECRLPDRTTSVVREGISYTLSDPINPLSTGSAGLPDVDLFVRRVNPRQATRTAGLFTPDSPPPVVRAVRSTRLISGGPVAGTTHGPVVVP